VRLVARSAGLDAPRPAPASLFYVAIRPNTRGFASTPAQRTR